MYNFRHSVTVRLFFCYETDIIKHTEVWIWSCSRMWYWLRCRWARKYLFPDCVNEIWNRPSYAAWKKAAAIPLALDCKYRKKLLIPKQISDDIKQLSHEICQKHNDILKKEYEWLKEVDKFALTNAIYNVDCAYQKFFKEHAGYPKFKSKHDNHKSYTTNFTNGNIAVDFEDGNNYYKQKKKIASCHEKITNTRKDYLHKVSHEIISENQVIVSEDLQIKNMVKNHHLAKYACGDSR